MTPDPQPVKRPSDQADESEDAMTQPERCPVHNSDDPHFLPCFDSDSCEVCGGPRDDPYSVDSGVQCFEGCGCDRITCPDPFHNQPPSPQQPPVEGGQITDATPKYRTIVADPPWPFHWVGTPGGRRRRGTGLGYKIMTIEDIAALPVADLADPDGCNLFLWATDEVYREGQAVYAARAWGFEPVGPSIIWKKDNYGVGFFPRPGHEALLICRTKGAKAIWMDDFAVRATHSVQSFGQARAANGGGKIHSAKPDAALDLIEAVSPGPRVELFARRARFGWDYWGDESLGTAEMPREPSREG